MNQSTRQRVVGTIVLLLAAIVVLPAILDGSGVPARDVEERIPARPVTDSEPLEVDPRRPEITADSDDLRLTEELSDDEPVPDEETAVADSGVDESRTSANNDRPSLDQATGLPEAWSVQLGAFSNPSNVEALVDRLQSAGHSAYTRAIESSSDALTGVFVGPLVDRDAAVDLQAELQSSFGLAGRVVRYRIEEE
ncbi:MAG: SPOR domain-containing protein [Pseudohongiellaceae bacterium]